MVNQFLSQLDMNNTLIPNEKLIVGGQPSIADLQLLTSHGLKTVVNLRPSSKANEFDEESVVTQLGLNYCHIPVSNIASLTLDACHKLHQVLAAVEPCLIHCATGNRVGALIALKSYWLDKLSAEQSIECGRQSGLTLLEPQVSELIGL